MFSDDTTDDKAKRWILTGMLTLVGVTVLSVGVLQLSKDEPIRKPLLTDARLVSFADGPDASVIVLGQAGEELTRFERGTNGFARVLLRGMTRERRKHGVPIDEPFELGWDGAGLLVLSDPITPTHVTLNAFGSTNAQVFADLLARVDAP